MKTYETSKTHSGDAARILDFLTAALAGANFQILERTPSTLAGVNPRAADTRSSALAGVSRIDIRASGGTITAIAQFGGFRRLFFLMSIIGVATAVGLVAALSASSASHGSRFFWLLPLIPLAPWPILLPVIMTVVQRRGCQAIDLMLSNAVTATQ